ncbi:MAG: hypothetical protein IM504_17390 [Microcystis sp. M038S2]|uniref:hypothetical protein n=1 Tax=unclassified Microcystis TaxID=2643300 RepID=UPI00258C1444|nr:MULTISPECIES: hypothetical protein [unclassified Microcystis]MCA2686082.1 hypothetical protein [Microcystis sp. M046S2]MCA2706541.1 hypothetical protein [Microcystis sp. M038S2]MCA2947264.1 hypothetical protein [Microcystis sp. M109S1]MCA2951945.1 hypothetical protein [Microcystis sp. M112S1]
MAGVTSTVVKESAEELTQRIKEATTPREKDKLPLNQEKAPTLKVIATSLGHHRNTVQTWLCKYLEEGNEKNLIDSIWYLSQNPYPVWIRAN